METGDSQVDLVETPFCSCTSSSLSGDGSRASAKKASQYLELVLILFQSFAVWIREGRTARKGWITKQRNDII